MELNTNKNGDCVESWLITGGCGFIGTNLTKHILKNFPKNKVRILDNLSSGSINDFLKACKFVIVDEEKNKYKKLKNKNSKNEIEFYEGDIKNFKACLLCSEKIDVIVHLAANTGIPQSVENPKNDLETNVIGTFNILEAARKCGVEKFIFASSGAPLGDVTPPIHEEIAPHPVSPYGASKLAGEGYCSAFYRTFNLNTVVLRFANVYGPHSRNKESVVAKFIKKGLRNDVIEIFGDGNQTRDFIFVEDLVNAIILSAERNKFGGEVFQIATNKETTVNELIKMLKKNFSNLGINYLKTVNASLRIGDIRRNFSDITKAQKLLRWDAMTKIDDGIKKTINWYLEKL